MIPNGRVAAGPTAESAAAGTSYHPVMKTSGITAALPAQDLGRAKAFYVENVGLQALESGFLEAADGQVGLTVGDGVSQFFVYPARVRSSGEFTQAVIHVSDVRLRRPARGGAPRPQKRAFHHKTGTFASRAADHVHLGARSGA